MILLITHRRFNTNKQGQIKINDSDNHFVKAYCQHRNYNIWVDATRCMIQYNS